MTSKRSARRISRPSPALVVAIIALVVACTGTAIGAGVLVKHSGQLGNNVVSSRSIKNNSVQGLDIKKGTITGALIKKGTIDSSKLSSGTSGGGTTGGVKAYEAFNHNGPSGPKNTAVKVATLSNLPPGPYAIFAKTIGARQFPNVPLIPINTTAGIECTLDAAGDTDRAADALSGPGWETQAALNMQITRSFDHPSDVSLTCAGSNADWRVSNTSIIAIALNDAGRSEVGG